MIRQAGYTVITVPDADAAWDVLQSADVAVVLEGIAVRTATGAETIRVAEAEPPALVVLDAGLPERDGFDVVDAMRQRPELRGIPVLVYTACDLTEEQRGRLRPGPTRFLTKSKASDEDFRRLVVELRQIPLARGADTGTRS